MVAEVLFTSILVYILYTFWLNFVNWGLLQTFIPIYTVFSPAFKVFGISLHTRLALNCFELRPKGTIWYSTLKILSTYCRVQMWYISNCSCFEVWKWHLGMQISFSCLYWRANGKAKCCFHAQKYRKQDV